MQQHVVEDAAQRIAGVVVLGRDLHRFADGDAQAAGAVGVLVENGPAGGGDRRGAGMDHCAPHLHHRLAVGLLVVGGAYLPHLAVETVEGTRIGEGAAPLAGARLRGQLAGTLLGVVVGLRDRGVRLVGAGGADPLVLVVDAGRRLECLLQAPRPVQRAGPPLLVDVEHGTGNVDVAVLAHLLQDEGHGEQRRQIVRPHRLLRARVEHGRRRLGKIRDHVVPLGGQLGLVEQDLGVVLHSRVLRWGGTT